MITFDSDFELEHASATCEEPPLQVTALRLGYATSPPDYSSYPPPQQQPYGYPPQSPYGGYPPQSPYGGYPPQQPYGMPPPQPYGYPPQSPYGAYPSSPYHAAPPAAAAATPSAAEAAKIAALEAQVEALLNQAKAVSSAKKESGKNKQPKDALDVGVKAGAATASALNTVGSVLVTGAALAARGSYAAASATGDALGPLMQDEKVESLPAPKTTSSDGAAEGDEDGGADGRVDGSSTAEPSLADLLQGRLVQRDLAFFSEDDQFEILMAMGQATERAEAFAEVPMASKQKLFQRFTASDQGRCLAACSAQERAVLFSDLSAPQRKAMLDEMSAKDRAAVLLNKEKTWFSEISKSVESSMEQLFPSLTKKEKDDILGEMSSEEKARLVLGAANQADMGAILAQMTPVARAHALTAMTTDQRRDCEEALGEHLRIEKEERIAALERSVAAEANNKNNNKGAQPRRGSFSGNKTSNTPAKASSSSTRRATTMSAKGLTYDDGNDDEVESKVSAKSPKAKASAAMVDDKKSNNGADKDDSSSRRSSFLPTSMPELPKSWDEASTSMYGAAQATFEATSDAASQLPPIPKSFQEASTSAYGAASSVASATAKVSSEAASHAAKAATQAVEEGATAAKEAAPAVPPLPNTVAEAAAAAATAASGAASSAAAVAETGVGAVGGAASAAAAAVPGGANDKAKKAQEAKAAKQEADRAALAAKRDAKNKASGSGAVEKRGAFGGAFEKLAPSERAQALAATLTGLSAERRAEFLAAMSEADRRAVEKLEDARLGLEEDDNDSDFLGGSNLDQGKAPADFADFLKHTAAKDEHKATASTANTDEGAPSAAVSTEGVAPSPTPAAAVDEKPPSSSAEGVWEQLQSFAKEGLEKANEGMNKLRNDQDNTGNKNNTDAPLPSSTRSAAGGSESGTHQQEGQRLLKEGGPRQAMEELSSEAYLTAHGRRPDVTADERSKVQQLSRLRFPGLPPGDALCQIGVLLKAEGQMRDALTAFELAADAAELVGLSETIDAANDEFEANDVRPSPQAANMDPQEAADAAAALGDILYNLGITLYDAGFPAAAVAVLQRCVKLLPQDADAHAGLGASLAVLRRHAEAAAAFRTSLELDGQVVDTHCRLAEALHNTGDFDGAIDVVRSGLELDGASADLHCRLGASLGGLGLLGPASESLQVAIQLDEEHPEAHYHLGRVLRRQQRAEEANEHFRLVVDSDPTHTLARVALAEGHYSLNDLEGAHYAYKQALMFDGRSAPALHGLGATLLAMGKAPAAERVFELLTQLYPQDTQAFLGRGACAEQQSGGSVRAVQAYEAVLQRDSNHFGAHLALAHVCATRGEHQVAVAEYRWCLERKPSDRDALVRFGEALVALDRGDEARLVLEQVRMKGFCCY